MSNLKPRIILLFALISVSIAYAADITFSSLSTLTNAQLQDADSFPVVDSSDSNNMKRITAGELSTKVLNDLSVSNVTDLLDGATLTDAGTPATDDKVLIQDTSDSDNLKYVDANTLGGASVADSTCPAGQAPRSFTSGVFAGCFNAADQTASQVPLTDTDNHFGTDTVEFAIDQLADNTCTIIIGPESGVLIENTASGAIAGTPESMEQVTIVGGSMDASSSLRVEAYWSTNNVVLTGSSPIGRIEFGGNYISRRALGLDGNDKMAWGYATCWSQNSTSSVYCPPATNNIDASNTNINNAYEQHTVDLTSNLVIDFMGDIGDSANHIALHHYKIEICR